MPTRPQNIYTQETHLQVLRLVESTPDLTQRQLAAHLGVSLGKANYCIKALIQKGWIKWGNFERNPNKGEYAYLLTPGGIAGKVALTQHFLERKAGEYAALRAELQKEGSMQSVSAIPAIPVTPLRKMTQADRDSQVSQEAQSGISVLQVGRAHE